MTTIEPKISPLARLELREAAEALGVNKSTILRWTRKGILRAGVKRSNCRKFWTGAELIRLWRASM